MFKKRKNSLRKGHCFELACANFLTKRLGVKFNRVPQSGATATVQGTTNPMFNGDVFTDAPAYQDLCIECKAFKRSVLLEDLFNRKAQLWRWWEQAKKEAMGKKPVLIFKGNYGEKMLMSDNADTFMRLKGLVQNRLQMRYDKGEYFVGVLEWEEDATGAGKEENSNVADAPGATNTITGTVSETTERRSASILGS